MNRYLPFLSALALASPLALTADPADESPKALPIPNGALAAPVAGGPLAAPGASLPNGQGYVYTPPANVRIEVQVVAIPERLAVEFINEMKNKDKIEAAYAKIQGMLAKGTAKLIGWPIVTTHSGQRAVIESIREIRYATEYSPPTVGVMADVSPDPAVKVEPKVDVTVLAGIPSAFQTRSTGVTLEVEPVVASDGKTIDLNMIPQHVRLKGFEKATVEDVSGKGKAIVEQPQFDTMKVTTSLHLLSGRRMLLGAFRTDDPPKHFEFFILKAETVPMD